MQSMNINDDVVVVPTELGARVYREYFLALGQPPPRDLQPGHPFRGQLWSVMAIWGFHMGNGLELVLETEIKLPSEPRSEDTGAHCRRSPRHTWESAEAQRQKDLESFKRLLEHPGDIHRRRLMRCMSCDSYAIKGELCPMCGVDPGSRQPDRACALT